MRLRRLVTWLAALTAASAPALAFATPAHADTFELTCWGSVGCAGTAVNSSCSADESLIEQWTVGAVGQLMLYESPVCDTAWATLVIDTSGTYAGRGYEEGYRYIAEIFYEGPTGGPEQFDLSAAWDGNSTAAESTLTTPMLPASASFKACGGAPADATSGEAPFDEDPQGLGGISEPQLYPGLTTTPTSAPGGPPTDYNAGTCTHWH